MAWVQAFIRAGRLRVTVATPSTTSHRTGDGGGSAGGVIHRECQSVQPQRPAAAVQPQCPGRRGASGARAHLHSRRCTSRVSDDQQFFQETTRKFLEQETPLTTVRALADDPAGFDRAWWVRGAELGWTSLLVPEADGGGSLSGEGLLDLVIVAEEMGRLVAPGPLGPTNIVAAAVAAGGSSELRASVLPGIVAGEVIGAWCVAGPGGAWDGAGVAVTAARDGDDFVLDGVATPVEAGGQADELLVTADRRTAHGRAHAAAGPGGHVRHHRSSRSGRSISCGASRPCGSTAFGYLQHGSSATSMPPRARWNVSCNSPSCWSARRPSARSIACFEFTLEYLADRTSFGRPLASYQAIKHRFADMKMWLEAAHGATELAARSVHDDTADASEVVSATASYIGDHATEIVQECTQLHGGIGVTWEHDLHLYLRRVTLDRNLHGTPAEHRERLAAIILTDEQERADD